MMHQWISTDTDEHTACLVCGGMWVDERPQSVVASMTAINGEPAVTCTGNTDQCHHYADECSVTDGSGCKIDPECNCLFCYS